MITEKNDLDIVINTGGIFRKIAKIKFGPRGDIYVFFSKFIPSQGVMSILSLGAGTNEGKADFAKPGHGKVTSHIVKYSHHPDGNAHFSQDGKIRTEIRKKSFPLGDLISHFFTLQFQCFNNFPEFKKNPQVPHFNIDYNGNKCLKILGRWFKKDAITPANTPKTPGLPMMIQSRT